ncbi:MAG: amidohydrolase family protein [Spirochaetes bacterium]|nr:amidohydrolase family protein [Spirochaetota bacterium]
MRSRRLLRRLFLFSMLVIFILGALVDDHPLPVHAGEAIQLPHPEQQGLLHNDASGLVVSIYKHSNGKLYTRLGKVEEAFGSWRTVLLKIQPAGVEGRVKISGGPKGPFMTAGQKGSLEVSAEEMPASVWRMSPHKGGGFRIVSDASGLALTVLAKDGEKASAALMEIQDSPGQSWNFMPLAGAGFLAPRDRGILKSVPIIDVHVHATSPEAGASYLGIRERLLSVYNVDIAAWISVNSNIKASSAFSRVSAFRKKTGGRFFTTTNEAYMDALKTTPKDVERLFSAGVVGFKMWWGNSEGIDSPANDQVYAKMAELGMPTASAHIGKGGTSTEALEAFAAWSRVMKRHPALKAVTAHMGNQMYRKDPFGEIEAMMEAHPNFYVDTSWSMTISVLSDRERLRNLFIRRSDRILFGTDIGSGVIRPERYEYMAVNYEKVIRFLETDEWVHGPLWLGGSSGAKLRGLALPREVLDTIYYKNAARIYPGVAEGLRKLGYSVEIQ